MQDGANSRVLMHVADNVRRFRLTADLSQASLADKSGISRRTIVKLEAGEANISLTGLDHLADALGVTFVDLVAAPTALHADISEVAWEGAGPGSVASLLASVPASRDAQLWSWSLDAGDRYEAEPDPVGWFELIFVAEGSIRVEHESGIENIDAGGHLAFPTSQRYAYVNPTDRLARFTRVVVS